MFLYVPGRDANGQLWVEKHAQRGNLHLTQYVSLISCTAHAVICVQQQYLLFEIR